MTFQKGNPYGGKREGAGRPKASSTLIREALDDLDTKLPTLIEMLYKKALEGDVKCTQYLVDRRLGKPSETSTVTLDAKITNFLELAKKARGITDTPEIPESESDEPITTTNIIDVDTID